MFVTQQINDYLCLQAGTIVVCLLGLLYQVWDFLSSEKRTVLNMTFVMF